MKNLFIYLTLSLLTFACVNDNNQSAPQNKLEMQLKALPFKIADNIDVLKSNIQASTTYEVEDIIDIIYADCKTGTEYVEVIFKTNGYEKNIMYVKSGSELAFDGIVNIIEGKEFAPVIEIWCDDCPECQLRLNPDTQVFSCHPACCSMYIR